MNNDDLKSRLTDEQYQVTQMKGTERPFTGRFVDHKDDGTYRIRGLKDGVYQVKAMAGGYCQGAGQRVVVAAEQAYQIDLVVNKGGFVKVKVIDRNGGSVTGASVWVIDAGGNRWGAPPGGEGGRGGKRPDFDPGEGGDSGLAGGGMPSRTNAMGEFRIPNAICPGPTDTPLAQANKEIWLAFGADYREETGLETSTPAEQAYPLLFLCSDAAVGINGITLITDAGYMMSGITGSFPNATMMAKVLMGRT